MSKANASYGHYVLARHRVEQLEAQLRRSGIEPEAPTVFPWNPKLAMRIEDFEMSTRTFNALTYGGIEYVYQICLRTEYEAMKMKHFGRVSLKELKELLDDLGLSLGMNLEGYPRPEKP